VRARRAAAAALAAVALALVATPAAHASLLVEHAATAATETSGNGDGLVGPGDTFSVFEQIHSSESQLTGIQGTLSTSTPGIGLGNASSAYPDMAFDDLAVNSTPFSATVPASAECGINVDFNLHLATDQGPADVPFTVPTGTAGPPASYDSADVPRVVPDFSTINSALAVPDSGRLKDVRVRIGSITHGYVSDLRIDLVAPDGTTVLLVDRRGGNGQDFANTVFTSDPAAPSIIGASAPFTGTFRPEGDLGALVGKAEQGTWKLRVSDQAPNDSGTLQAWGLDLRSAVCDGRPRAAFTATPSPALPGQQVTFDASASTDPNGTVVSYAWDLDGNGTYETSTGSNPVLTHTFPVRGSYSVGLQVTDDSNATGTVIHSVSVTQPPVADLTASPPNPLTAQDVTLDASGSTDPDPGGAIVRYEWDLNGDGTFEHDTGATPTTTTQFATPGSHTVRVRVTDQDGATAVKSLDVVAQNRPPTAAFTAPAPAVTGATTTFDAGTSADPDGTVVLYEWDLDGNGTFETITGSNPQASTTYAAAGDVTVHLRVTDNDGATDTTSRVVHVTHPPVASFTATPNPVSLNAPVAFDASASSDPDGPLAKYEWDLDGNGSFETDTGLVPTTSHSYPANGTYAVKLRVTDADGATAVTTVNVVASNGLPLAALSVGPNPALTGQPVTLDATGATDPDGTIVKYDWDLDGNGSFETPGGTTPTLVHAYPNPGAFDVGVRVTDNDGGTGVARVHLVVAQPPDGGGGGGGGTTGGSTGGGAATGGGGGTADGGGAAAGGGDDAGGGGPRSLTVQLTGSPIQRLAAVLSRGLDVGCGADRPATCSMSAELGAREARRLGLRSRRAVTLGRLVLSLPTAGRRAARLRLTAAGRRALRQARQVTIVVRGVATDAHGGRVTLTRAFLIRR
jgi:YD repeat-containing protein